jgi:hypothetical protein
VKTIICGIPFEITEVENCFGSEHRFGECDTMAATIKLNRHCSPEQKDATLVHEWVHGVGGCNGTSQDEDLISVIAIELYRQGFRVKVEE